MGLFFLLWLVVPGGLCWCAHAVPRNKVKIVEDYVVSAKLDENQNFPQLQQRSQLNHMYRKDSTKALPEPTDVSLSLLSSSTSYAPLNSPHQPTEDFQDRNILEDRGLVTHHHHLPPPPSAPPPIGLHYAPSFFAIGLITFLLLLNSLQTSLLVMKTKGSLLGSVTGALGRRKRFADEDVNEFGKFRLNFTQNRH